jgi:hypothetical protein
MKKAYSFIFLIAFSLMFAGCGKNRYCRIIINTPQDNQVFNRGTLINIDAKIYDDGDAIMSESLTVTTIPANDTVLVLKDNEFTFEYPIHVSFTSAANTQYKIEVQALGGHGNWASKSVHVTCN